MSDRLIVIGLTGPANSGKDTAANILTALHGFHRVALADGVKGAFDDLSGPTKALHKDLSDEFSQRKAWQILGTECRDDMGERAMWVSVACAKIRYLSRYHPRPVSRFVVPDVSFHHEINGLAHRVRNMWGGHYETWRIERPGLAPIADQHASEEGRRTIPADRVIANDAERGKLALDLGWVLCGMLEDIGAPLVV